MRPHKNKKTGIRFWFIAGVDLFLLCIAIILLFNYLHRKDTFNHYSKNQRPVNWCCSSKNIIMYKIPQNPLAKKNELFPIPDKYGNIQKNTHKQSNPHIKPVKQNKSLSLVQSAKINPTKPAETKSIINNDKTQKEFPKALKNLINDFVWVKGGCFNMKCIGPSERHNAKNNTNTLTCVKGFWMGKHEITYQQFQFFLNNIKDKIKLEDDKVYLDGELIFDWRCDGCGRWKDGIKWNGKKFIIINEKQNYPVVLVTWYGARAFAKWLSRQTGHKYSIPNESEWEYAAQSRTMQLEYATASGQLSHDLANYKGKKGKDIWEFTSPIGSFPPNPLGLYDMCGNVWEWCKDIYKKSTYECKGNPIKCMSYDAYDERVIRGGSALNNNESGSLKCAFRYGTIPDYTGYGLGFRLIRQP